MSYSCFLLNTINEFNPTKVYNNFKNDRSKIIKENKNKKGIYLLVNLINGNFYIGSSINLSNRMQNYLNIKYLNTNSNKNMPIIKSLLKYGHDNFALLILEYIDSEDISERETYWITKSSPYYNVLKKAYSSVPLSRCPASR